MVKNLTLTIDDDILRAARKIAIDRETSVNRMVREYLGQMVQERCQQQLALAELKKIFRNSPYRIGQRTWRREDLYARADGRSK